MPSNNIYNNAGNRDRVAPNNKTKNANLQPVNKTAKGPNNVYGDKNGNVQRQTSQGNWQSRDQGQWKSSSSNMNRDAGARRSGAARSGGMRGGGGGRRR
jgi:hypothetical protein